ncbi:Beta-glucosidase [termite gut metagenome]|uniref:Beta-glucosidase n=1 Tax=termite gut metagenome TaxID=433724 RepID=A0A5J4SRD5_9ZZZZ
MKHLCTMGVTALLSCILCLSGCSLSDNRPPSKLIKNEAKIKSIIKKMTLEEKIAMIHGKHMFTSAGVERLGIADIIYADGPFGIREEMEPHSWHSLGLSNDSSTFFPTGSALAATWSKDLAYTYGKSLAQEARLRGKDMILGPAINIQRLPTGGRTYEYLSEDPFLNAQLSVGYTQGVQDNGVAVCLKHYALNNQENNRGRVNVIVNSRTMREIYLLPFEAAVKEADAYGVMAAYNKVAGDWCSENDLLLNQILRNEWKFKGMVISDWGGVHHTVNAALHGLDVEMPNSRFFGQALLDSIQAGTVPVSVIDEKVRNILRVRFAIEPIPAEEANKTMTAQPEQLRVAYDVAAKSIVLLKNKESFLPLNLNQYKKIAVIGENAIHKQANGGYGAGVKALYEVTPLEGLQAKIGDQAEIAFSQGYRGFTGQERISHISPYSEADPKLLQEAVKTAKNADIVLFIAGNNREVETEGSDRTQMTLPSGQDEVIKAIAAVNPNIVTIVVAGAPVDLSVVEAYSSSIVISWFNGTEGGNALADVLLGNISPSGKLPFTFPVKLEDSPAYALNNYPQTTTETGGDKNVAVYSEELLVGYRWFDTKGIAPRYSFGHGLSYTTFEYTNLQTKKEQYGSNESIDVTFELKNTGEREADEVVQLYVHRLDATIEWPFKELKAFERVSLKGGESQTLTLTIPVSKLRYWNEDNHKWILEHSEIELMLGSSSSDIHLTKKVKI